jgi:hypothetical protein
MNRRVKAVEKFVSALQFGAHFNISFCRYRLVIIPIRWTPEALVGAWKVIQSSTRVPGAFGPILAVSDVAQTPRTLLVFVVYYTCQPVAAWVDTLLPTDDAAYRYNRQAQNRHSSYCPGGFFVTFSLTVRNAL